MLSFSAADRALKIAPAGGGVLITAPSGRVTILADGDTLTLTDWDDETTLGVQL